MKLLSVVLTILLLSACSTAPHRQESRGPSQAEDAARLNPPIQEGSTLERKRPKKTFISASTPSPGYEPYQARWVVKIETIGNNNYPAEAKRLGLSGRVIATVSIGRGGEHLGTRIDRSSGSRVLDDAVVHILSLASPFEPIPTWDDADILELTRTWDFKGGDQSTGPSILPGD